MTVNTQAAAAAEEKKTRFYALDNFYLKSGTQLGRMNDFVSKTLLPALEKQPWRPRIFLEAMVAPHMPQFAAISGFQSMEEMWSQRRSMLANEELQKAFEAWESGPEAPYEHYSVSLLEAADYSPEISPPAEAPKAPRIFELRTYHSPTWRQLRALHERFAGPEIRIFDRCGVHPILYTTMIFGQNLPNLTYLIPFESLAAREKAWAAFGADPEWIKVRKESTDKHGQVSSVIQISLYRATRYSPIR